MRTPLKAAVGILAAAAMLSIPALSNADDIQRSHPEDTTQSQTFTPSSATSGANPGNSTQTQTPSAPANSTDGNKSSASSAPRQAKPQSPSAQALTREAPQLPSAQGLCDSTVRNLGTNVTGQLTDVSDGCQLNISAGAGGGTLDKALLRAFPGLDTTVTQIVFVGPNTTMLPQDSSHLFETLPNLKGIDFSDFGDTSNVIDMQYMFWQCMNLTSLNLGSKFDTSQVQKMNYMFRELLNLPRLDLGSKFDTSQVQNMFCMFYQDEKLVSLSLGPNFNTHWVGPMDGMFEFCSELRSLDLGNKFNTQYVWGMGGMFDGDRKLGNVNFGNKFYATQVSNIAYMFYDCESMTSIDLGPNFNSDTVNAMYEMFDGCTKLQHVNLGAKFDTTDLDDFFGTWRMFANCPSLTSLNLGDKFNISNLGTRRLDLNVVANRLGTAEMFAGDTSLTYLNLGSNFNTSNVPDMEAMFKDCSSLTHLDLGNKFDTSKVRNMRNMFAGDTSLTSLDLGNKFDTSKVGIAILSGTDKDIPDSFHDMYGMFSGDTSLTHLNLGNKFDTANVPNMEAMFKDCSSLTHLDLGRKFNTSKVTDMNDMLSGCDNLKQLEIGKDAKLASTVNLLVANWVQLEVPGTDSAHVNQPAVVHYTSAELETRTSGTDTTRVGTYVRIANPNKLTLEPATTLPRGTSVADSTPVIQYSEKAVGTDVPVRDYDGNTLADPIASLVALDGRTATIPGNPFTLSGCPEAGCTFKIWTKKADGTGTTYQPGDQIDLSHGNVTLYATWEANKPKSAPNTQQGNTGSTGIATQAAPAIPTAASPVIASLASPVAAPIVSALTAATGQSGRDVNNTPGAKPAAPKKTNPKCVAIAWRTGDIHPAAYQCSAGESTASITPNTARQAPLWIFLLLLLITLFVLYALTRRSKFDVVRHRAAEAEK